MQNKDMILIGLCLILLVFSMTVPVINNVYGNHDDDNHDDNNRNDDDENEMISRNTLKDIKQENEDGDNIIIIETQQESIVDKVVKKIDKFLFDEKEEPYYYRDRYDDDRRDYYYENRYDDLRDYHLGRYD